MLNQKSKGAFGGSGEKTEDFSDEWAGMEGAAAPPMTPAQTPPAAAPPVTPPPQHQHKPNAPTPPKPKITNPHTPNKKKQQKKN